MQPIYTQKNTTPAFQLNWSVGLFGRVAFPPPSNWLDQMKADTQTDGVRILEARLANQTSASSSSARRLK